MDQLLASCVSQRRIARLLGIDRKTVVRKFLFLASQAKKSRLAYLERIQASGNKVEELEFDEMETFERSKCLPLSIPLVVESKTRKILGFGVAVMPAKGLLASISLKKYGRRQDHRPEAADALFKELRGAISENPLIRTDKNPKYPSWLKPHFENARHTTTKGRRGCVVGQGELKRGGFDPLFSLNHTAAMFRANVNRLARRTWATTKRPDYLLAHLEIYAAYHNFVLT